MKVNKNLKTKNKILNELNETYYVVPPLTKNSELSGYDFMVYEEPEGGGLNFYFGVTTNKSNYKVIFNGTVFDNVKELLAAVDEYNKTLPFPSTLYDPLYNHEYINRARIEWYLKDILGFEYDYRCNSDMRFYVKKDIYGGEISNIGFRVDENGKGSIYRNLAKYSWLESPFETVIDAIKSINGILVTEIISGLKDNLNSIEKQLNFGFSLDNTQAMQLDGALNTVASDYKKVAIEKIEEVLKQLKAEQP